LKEHCCILRPKLPSRVRLRDPERATLPEIGKRLERKALRAVDCVAKPYTILAWYRRLVAQKSDGYQRRLYPGRPAIAPEVELSSGGQVRSTLSEVPRLEEAASDTPNRPAGATLDKVV
jgi:hypothetical protein